MGMLDACQWLDVPLLFPDAILMEMRYLEFKRHLDKPDAVYLCELFARGDDYVLLRYVSEREEQVGDVEIMEGAVTYALYREGKGYVAWRMVESDGRLIGHLFHICKGMQIGESQVEYKDLMLDLWFSPAGVKVVLDREELDEFAATGAVSQEDLAWISSQEREINCRYRSIISELEGLVATVA